MSSLVSRSKTFTLDAENIVHFRQITPIASHFRAYRALHELIHVPEFIRRLLLAGPPLYIDYRPEKWKLEVWASINSEAESLQDPPTDAARVRTMVEQDVDGGSLTYLRNCLTHADTLAASSHFKADVQAMSCIGRADDWTSGICYIHGTPGTGKTTTILTILGAIIHHGVHGHVSHPHNICLPQRNKLRFGRDGSPLRVLVVAS